jgi:dihydroorotase
MRWVDSLSLAPAKLVPDLDAGTLRAWRAGDITVIDPDRRWTVTREALRSKSFNTPC